MILDSTATKLREVLAQGGLFHCTSVPALRVILREGHLRPALQTGAPARGAGIASRCRRLSGVCLFDVVPLAEGARSFATNPGGAWLHTWLTSYQPVTVAIHLDKAQLRAHGCKLLTETQTRGLAPGVMLRGEVCHFGAVPLAVCGLGFLFVRRRADGPGWASHFLAGYSLTQPELRRVLARLRRLAGAQAPAPRA